MSNFVKLKDLVGGTFTIKEVGLPTYKQWLEGEKRFVSSATPQEGYQKKYPVEIGTGTLELSQGQLGSVLMAAFDGIKSEVAGKTFKVASNGKTGLDIRYFFNLSNPDYAPNDVSVGQTAPPTMEAPF